MLLNFKIILQSIAVYSLLLVSCGDNNENLTDPACRLYESYKHGEMGEWTGIMRSLEREYTKNQQTETLLQLAQIQYGYIAFLIGSGEKARAKQFIVKAEKNVDLLLESNSKFADALALKASLMAFSIAINPLNAFLLGPQSLALLNEALASDPQSVQANLEKGNSLLYAPRIFGGNPAEAVKYYQISLDLMANQGVKPGDCSWQCLNALTQLALAYEKSGSMAQADSTYRYILQVAPDFEWASKELYPNLQKKNKEGSLSTKKD